MLKTLPGLNIQEPWASLLISGQKCVETRSYALPIKYQGTELALISTPGRKKKFKAQIIGTIIFSHSFKYQNLDEWISDSNRHCIFNDSIYDWNPNKMKYGWVVSKTIKFNKTLDAPSKRGIIFCKSCDIDEAFWY